MGDKGCFPITSKAVANGESDLLAWITWRDARVVLVNNCAE